MGCTFNNRKCVIFLISFEIKVHTCSFAKKNKADQSFSLQKYIFIEFLVYKISFYDNNVNPMSQLTRDHM